jgi:hypothetical protein
MAAINQTPNSVPQAVPLVYARDTKRLYSHGIDFNNPIDSLPDGFYPILENIRSYTDGILQPRQGITQVSAGVITNSSPVHSVRRLNNALNSTWTRVVGAGLKLATGQTSFTNVQYNGSDVIFSGKPLALLPWRPDQSPVSWMYVADSSAMYKVTYNGSAVTTHKIGVAPPIVAPVAELAAPLFAALQNEFGALTHWASDGTVAGALTIQARIATTTLRIVNDGAAFSPTWASVVPTAMTNIGPGTIIDITYGGPAVDTILIEEVYRGSSATTIATILYDTNPINTGNCIIVPTAPLDEIKRNAVVLLNADITNGYARITEVMAGPNNTVAFRCNTGATTFSATQSLQIKGSFRAYNASGAWTVTGGDNLNDTAGTLTGSIKSTFTAGATLIGYVTLTPTAALDFTKMSLYTPSASVGITDLDYFHISFKASDLSQFVEGKILFDCGDGSFNQNFFYRSFTPSDLVVAAKNTQTSLVTKTSEVTNSIISDAIKYASVQRRAGVTGDRPLGRNSINSVLGDSGLFSVSAPDVSAISTPDTIPGEPRDQTGTGDNQWSEIRFRRGDCVRVGTDWAKGWAAINKIRLQLTLISGGVVTVEINSFSIWGGYAPDIGDIGAPYRYRYRYRVSATGAASNWSPENRSGVLSLRSNNIVTCTVSAIPEVDLIDVQRWGGLISAWADVGTTLNSTGVFIDSTGDDTTSGTIADSVGNINFQPWLIAQPPKTGTTTTAAGTLIKDSGTNFNTSWVNGTGIKVGGLETTIRRVLSTSVLEVDDCIGTGAALAWQIAEPFIAGQPLPCMWGSANGWFFGCGDPVNPGRLYFSNQNNPDSTQDSYFIEVTAPSEPLQNGFTYNARNYVFSSEKLYEVVEIATGQFLARETPTGKGLMYRWAFCVGPLIWFLSKDGIYETDGGTSRAITFDQLYGFFPVEGTLGVAVNGFNPPNMVSGTIGAAGLMADASTFFRLCYEDSYIHFYYPDTSQGIMRCLTYALGKFSTEGGDKSGWYPDVFNPGGSNTGIMFGYSEEGDGIHSLLLGGADTTTGKLYTYGGTTDNGTPIPWHFRQASWDANDRRADKLFGDFIVDADPGGGTINVAAGINNYGSTLTLSSATMTGSGRAQKVFDINTGNGAEAKNLAIDLSGTGTTQRLFLLEPSYTLRPEDTFLRAIQYDDAGYSGEKFWQGIELEANTYNITRTIQVQDNTGAVVDTLNIQHNGRLQKPYSFSSAFVSHMARLVPADSALWKLFRWRWVYEPEPPLVTVWESQQTTFGHVGFVHLKAIWVTHTSTADLTLTITRMDDNTSHSYTITNSGGVRGQEFYMILGPPEFCKGKTFKFKITQAANVPFRIYQRNTGVLVKPWGSQQAFARWVGWGGDAGDGVAQI